MICIIKQSPSGEITGWMIASDTHEMRRRAQAAFDPDLAALMYRLEFVKPGKHAIAPGVTMLVD